MKVEYLLVLFIVLLGSCGSSHNPKGKFVKVGYYENDSIEFVVELLEDSITHYYRGYYRNGNLREEGFYDEGKKDSIWFSYDMKQNVIAKNNWKNRKMFGEQMEYYSSGGIKSYFFVDFNEKIVFKRKFDDKGKLIDDFGSYLPMIVSNWNKLEHFKQEDTLKVTLYVPTPPNCETKCFFSVSKDTLNKNWKNVPIIQNKAVFVDVVSEKGEMFCEMQIRVWDKCKKKDIITSKEIKFNVK